MVTDPGLLHVEGKRFLETKAHHRFSLIAFGGQRFEIQKHYADSRVRQHGNHIAPAFLNGSRKRPSGVGSMWMLAPMVVSGYLMQVSTADALRQAMAIAHWISSGAFVVAYVAHILFRVGAGSQPARRSA